jgi:hypothetical protein
MKRTSAKVQKWAEASAKEYSSHNTEFAELVDKSVAACMKQLEDGAAAVVAAVERELQPKKRRGKASASR